MNARRALFQAIADPASILPEAIIKNTKSICMDYKTTIIAEPGKQDMLISGQVAEYKIFKFPVYSVIAQQPAFYTVFKA